MHIFKSIHNGDIPLEDIEKQQIKLKRDLSRIKQGDPRDKSEEQKETIDNIKNLITQEKKLLKCIMIMLGTCLEIFMIQNKKEQDLKY